MIPPLNERTTSNATKLLEIVIADSGVGLTTQEINEILQGIKSSSNGTTGEQGYGFGLSLVKRLVDELNGNLSTNLKKEKELNLKLSYRNKLNKNPDYQLR